MAEASERPRQEAEVEAEVEAEHSVIEPARVVVSQSRVFLRDNLFDSGPHTAHPQVNDHDVYLPEKV